MGKHIVYAQANDQKAYFTASGGCGKRNPDENTKRSFDGEAESMMNRRKLGAEYETVAVRFLEDRGMRVIERNFRTAAGEIDIICRDGDALVFVEVKYRADDARGRAVEAVGPAKQRQIIKVAKEYLFKKRIRENTRIRFDCIGITGDSTEYIRDAFTV